MITFFARPRFHDSQIRPVPEMSKIAKKRENRENPQNPQKPQNRPPRTGPTL
jgi:hypothetical protein